MNEKNYEESLRICKEVNFGEYSRIFESYIMYLKGDINVHALLKAADTQSNIEIDCLFSSQIKAQCWLELGDFNGALVEE